jgi:hypothetical protein
MSASLAVVRDTPCLLRREGRPRGADLGTIGLGKSDLALRLIDRGAVLVSDDYTIVRRVSGRLLPARRPISKGGSRCAGSASSLSARQRRAGRLLVDLNLDVSGCRTAASPWCRRRAAVPVIAGEPRLRLPRRSR